MHASLRVLLKEVIDYAGLFPPAGLELEPALQNYVRYGSHPDSWMLSRFVCPAGRLGTLAEWLTARSAGASPPQLVISVVATVGKTPQEAIDALTADVKRISAFTDQTGPRAIVDTIEARLPIAIAQPDLVGDVTRVTGAAAPSKNCRVFIELPMAPSWKEDFGRLTAILHELNAADPGATTAGARFGVKLRCGGVTADAVPSTELVAGVIHHCREASVPLKFTAGLHHPLRHVDAGLQVPLHGFINVFMAGVLSYALHLEPLDLQAVIEEQDARQFHFADEGASWNDAFATASEIAVARRERVLSFGSCSFDEPREDLRRLRWL